MSNSLLNTLFDVRSELQNPKYDKGELTGKLLLTEDSLTKLKLLEKNKLIDDILILDNQTLLLDKVNSNYFQKNVEVMIFTKNLKDVKYYETLNEFIFKNRYESPTSEFCIYKSDYVSSRADKHPVMSKYFDVIKFISLLQSLADYVKDDVDGSKEFIFFHKKKLTMFVDYSENDLVPITFLNQLGTHFFEAHDKEERASIFKSELINLVSDIPFMERFKYVLNHLKDIFDNYLKSHLLYLEKFSYHDLKTQVDEDKLDFTKKIYGVVNDIQSKLIAVPAAYLLVLSQFDFSGIAEEKNILIAIGSILFAILLETLLSNQFGILKFIRNEIGHVKNELSNNDTELDLREFIVSFGDLTPLIRKQKSYLWIFRLIVWLVPITCLIMLCLF